MSLLSTMKLWLTKCLEKEGSSGWTQELQQAVLAGKRALKRWAKLNPNMLLKVGGKAEHTARMNDSSHYNPIYFLNERGELITTGIRSSRFAAMLETALICYAKYEPLIGINHNDKANLSGNAPYSATNLGAVYFVPVVPQYATQVAFNQAHVSYYLARQNYTPDQPDATGRKIRSDTGEKRDYRAGLTHKKHKKHKKHKVCSCCNRTHSQWSSQTGNAAYCAVFVASKA